MANNNNNQHATFWDFLQSYDPNQVGGAGRGVDHQPRSGPQFPYGFPFDPAQFNAWSGNGEWGPWGPRGGPFGGSRGRGGRHHQPGHNTDTEEEHDDESSPETMRETPEDAQAPPPPPGASAHPPPPPPPGAPQPPPPPPPPHSQHHAHPFGPGPHRRRGGCGRGRGRGGHRGHSGPPPPYAGPFDFRPLMHTFANHPFAQSLRDYLNQASAGPSGERPETQEDKFTPPVDIFNTEKAYVLHVALPGASKEDVGVHWEPEKSTLSVAGVVYRPGSEELLRTLTSGERKVGMFERSIKLPPAGSNDKEEVDGFGITAKMENGILVITVPKVEKESWTEIHKIDVD